MPILVAPLETETTTSIGENYPTQVSWISPAGKTTILTGWHGIDSGIMVKPGTRGLGMPTWQFYESTSPVFDGSTVHGVRANPRDIVIPLHVWGPDRPTYLALFRALLADLNPQLGEGTLRFREHDGSSATIGAYYASGLEGDDNDDSTGRHWMTAAIVFHAPRPFWMGDAVSFPFSAGGGTPINWYPFGPGITVSDSQIIGNLEINNLGNVHSYPVWTIKGPATGLGPFTHIHPVTGVERSWQINKALAVGETAIIDTQEGVKTAILTPGGTNLYEWMTISSDLWELNPGMNTVQLSVPGASPGVTLVTLSYQPRYLAATR